MTRNVRSESVTSILSSSTKLNPGRESVSVTDLPQASVGENHRQLKDEKPAQCPSHLNALNREHKVSSVPYPLNDSPREIFGA